MRCRSSARITVAAPGLSVEIAILREVSSPMVSPLVLRLFGWALGSSETESPSGKGPSAQPSITEAQRARKARTEAKLRAKGIAVNPGLPYVEDETEVVLRPAAEVLARALALSAVSKKALEHPDHAEFAREFAVRDRLSPRELAYFDDPSPSRRDEIAFSWRCEAAQDLLWALGVETGRSEFPNIQCDPQTVISATAGAARGGPPMLRPMSEILDMLDLVYRCHWATRNADVRGNSEKGDLDAGVTMERHHALNWLVNYLDQEWDDVTTDT